MKREFSFSLFVLAVVVYIAASPVARPAATGAATNCQESDRFKMLDDDLANAEGYRWSMIFFEMCRATHTDLQRTRLREILESAWEKTDHDVLADALRVISNEEPSVLPAFAEKIATLLNNTTNVGIIVDLIMTAREIKNPPIELKLAVSQRIGDHRDIVAIHAAVASVAFDQTNEQASRQVSLFLARPEAEIIWRTAVAVGGIREKGSPWLSEYHKMAEHADVRVRVAAAFAIWRSKGDSIRSVPILVEAISQKNVPMAALFIYPSNTGYSHRLLAVRTLAEMGKQAADALPILKRAAIDADRVFSGKDWQDSQDSQVGLNALVAIAAIAAPNPDLATELVTITSREGTIFTMFPHVTAEALQRISVGTTLDKLSD